MMLDRHYFIPKKNRPLRCNICFGFITASNHIPTPATDKMIQPFTGDGQHVDVMFDEVRGGFSPDSKRWEFTPYDLHWMRVIEKGDWLKPVYEARK